MKSKFMISLVLLIGLIGLSITAYSESVLVWKLAHSGRNDDMLDTYAKKFKEIVEQEFNGKVQIQLFPAEQLGDDTARLELAQIGGVEFAIVAAPFIGNVVPEMLVYSLNFIFSEDKRINARVLHEGKAAKELAKKLEVKNIKVMDWISEDFSCWTSNKPIRRLKDIEGQKIRVMESPMDIEGIRVLGASPTPISFAEVYSSLQLNMVDGQQNPIVIINSNKFNEVQKYLTLSNHTVVVDIVASNPRFWNSLSKEEQDKLAGVFKKVNAFVIEKQTVQTNKALEEIKKAGTTEIIELSEEQREEFKEASKAAQAKFIELAGDSGRRILALLLEDIREFEGEAGK